MHIGAVAILDALGFKGIWGVHGADAVLDKMRRVRRKLELRAPQHQALAAGFHSGNLQHDLQCAVLFLSDTIVYACSVPSFAPETDPRRLELLSGLCVYMACAGAHEAIATGAIYPPSINYRGAVAFGEFQIDGNFLIGPAVDAAAEQCEIADAAMVHIVPGATVDAFNAAHRVEVDTNGPHSSGALMCLEYDVPRKGRDGLRTLVINPFGVLEHKYVVQFKDGIVAGFGSPVPERALSKFDNTRTFLEYAWRHSPAWLRK